MEFVKNDQHKIRYDLVPPKTLCLLAKVLTYGAEKYEPNNWKNCKDLERYKAAAMRHFEAYRLGEYKDAETNLPHLAHALCNLTFLLELEDETL